LIGRLARKRWFVVIHPLELQREGVRSGASTKRE
jgi:hypothetical protein